jgi:hypothetical protein
MVSIILELTSEKLPGSGHIYTPSEKRAKRWIPIGNPPIEISPIGAVNALSAPVDGTTNTQLTIKFVLQI